MIWVWVLTGLSVVQLIGLLVLGNYLARMGEVINETRNTTSQLEVDVNAVIDVFTKPPARPESNLIDLQDSASYDPRFRS